MPEKGAGFDPWKQLLSYDELASLAKIFTELGIRKIRITGGEPLVRPNLSELIFRLLNFALFLTDCQIWYCIQRLKRVT